MEDAPAGVWCMIVSSRDYTHLRVMEDGGGGCSSRGVVHDRLQQGFVQLRLVKPAQHEQDVRADALGKILSRVKSRVASFEPL